MISRKFLSLTIAGGILIPNIVLAEPVVLQQGGSNITTISDRNYVGQQID